MRKIKIAPWPLNFEVKTLKILFSSVQSLSRIWLFATPWTAARRARYPSPTPGVHPVHLCRSLLLLPSIFPSIRVFSKEWALRIRWQSSGVSASASGLPMNIQDWFPVGFNLHTVLETLNSLIGHHSSKASILRHSAFFRVQLSHPYMTLHYRPLNTSQLPYR